MIGILSDINLGETAELKLMKYIRLYMKRLLRESA